MGLRKLYQRKDQLQDELYMLHFAEPSPELYQHRRSEIEYEIACIEDQIDFEISMRPFRVTLMVFVVIAMLGLTFLLIAK